MATSVLSEQLQSSLMALAASKLPATALRGMSDFSSTSYDDHSGRHRPQSQHSNPAADDDDDDEFQINIPAILTQAGGGGLGRMDQQILRDCLQPVVKSLKALDAESLLNLDRVENGARLCDGVNVRPIHDEVFPRYDCFGGAMSIVRYIHITEVPEQYSIGIFVFPPFSRIPLHDHPEMCVLSRLLYGDLQCLSLDLPDAGDDEDMAAVSTQAGQPSGQQHHPQQQQQSSRHHPRLPAGLPEGSRRAFKNSIKHLHAPDVSMLFPYKGNLHEFYAGPNGAAVLDILLPPYDVEHERDCTFYDIREDPVAAVPSSANHPQPMMMDIDGTTPMMVPPPAQDENGRIPCWIVPTDQPHDFHCLSGQYQKLGTNVISMQDG